MLDHGDRLTAGRLDGAAPTLVRLSAQRPRVAAGEAAALVAHVVTVHGEEPKPSGNVAFRAGHRLLGTAPLDADGTARLDGVRLPTGLHAIVASYGGDASHAAATSAPVPQAVVVPASPVVVAVETPLRSGRGAVLRAELLDPATGRLVEEASGVLTFAVGGQVLGGAPLRGGEATLEVVELPEGPVTARFHGDVEHAAADGAAPGAAG